MRYSGEQKKNTKNLTTGRLMNRNRFDIVVVGMLCSLLLLLLELIQLAHVDFGCSLKAFVWDALLPQQTSPNRIQFNCQN